MEPRRYIYNEFAGLLGIRCPTSSSSVCDGFGRNARGGPYPDPIRAAHMAVLAGADGITAHLREDRRHIRDEDMERLKRQLFVPLNMEMAAISPPFGLGLFVMKAVAPPGTSMMDVYRATIPFLLLNSVVMLIMIFFPQTVLWLPSLAVK